MRKNSVDYQLGELYYDIINSGFTYQDPNRKGVERTQLGDYKIVIDCSDWEFPALRLRKVSPKVAFAEFKGFFLGLTDLHSLENMGCKFWRKDAYRFAIKTRQFNGDFEEFEKTLPNVDMGAIYPHQMYRFQHSVNQIDLVLDEIRKNPHGTKRTVTMWNPSEVDACALTPCHWSFELIVEGDELSLKWHQHSVDAYLGLPYNVMYYAYALFYFSTYLGLKPKNLIGDLSNVHLYDNQYDVAKIVVDRFTNVLVTEPLPDLAKFKWGKGSPQLTLDFRTFVKTNTCEVVGYKSLGELEKVEMLTYSE